MLIVGTKLKDFLRDIAQLLRTKKQQLDLCRRCNTPFLLWHTFYFFEYFKYSSVLSKCYVRIVTLSSLCGQDLSFLEKPLRLRAFCQPFFQIFDQTRLPQQIIILAPQSVCYIKMKEFR